MKIENHIYKFNTVIRLKQELMRIQYKTNVQRRSIPMCHLIFPLKLTLLKYTISGQRYIMLQQII